MPELRRLNDTWLPKVATTCAQIMAVSAVVAFLSTVAWAWKGVPEVLQMIDKRVIPIERAMEYNEAQHRAMMSVEQSQKADEIYARMQREKGQ